jgi:hypothetical protein
MGKRILPKSLPKHILKKIQYYAAREVGIPESKMDECSKREYTDKDLHGMLQDLLDAGGLRGQVAEVNISIHHQSLKREIEQAKSADKPGRIEECPRLIM